MTKDYLFHAGEATVLARDGQFTDAMPEILIGRTDGPVGAAFANMMAQSKGHTAMFAIRACNQLVRPATIDRAEGDAEGQREYRPVRRRRAIGDRRRGGRLPDRRHDPASTWPTSCASSAWSGSTRAARRIRNLDKKDMYRTNHEATKLAIKRALANEPSVDELIANRQRIRHDMDDWS